MRVDLAPLAGDGGRQQRRHDERREVLEVVLQAGVMWCVVSSAVWAVWRGVDRGGNVERGMHVVSSILRVEHQPWKIRAVVVVYPR